MRPCLLRRRLLWLALLAMAVTGCLRSTTTVVVNDDGAGTADIVVAVDSQAASTQVKAGVPGLPAVVSSKPEDICAAAKRASITARLPAGARTADYDDGQLCGQRISFAFSTASELTSAFNILVGATTTGRPILSRDGQDWVFDAPLIRPLDLVSTQALNVPPALVSQVDKQSQTVYQVTLPGQAVGANNADTVDGGTFTWTVTADNPRTRLEARTGTAPAAVGPAAGSRFPLVAAVVAAIGLIALAIAAWWLLRRRQAQVRAPAPAGTGGSPEAVTVEPPGAVAAGMISDRIALPTDDPMGRTVGRAGTPDDPVVAEPRWDPGRQAWVADHPVEGLLVHDDEAGLWRRAT